MNWYQGDIAEAVNISKQKNAVFVVYIEGKDEASQQLTTTINSETIHKVLESQSFVAIKIEADSVPHQQFSQIYKDCKAPSIYFIGKSGSPIEIVKEACDPTKLLSILEKVLGECGKSLKDVTSSLLSSERESSDVVCENGVCYLKKEPAEGPKEGESSISINEKLERAKELVAKQQKLKEIEEKENEKRKEIERRKLGQNVQQLKRWQEDQELKQLKEERQRQKREDQAARDRVLAQIAQDKAERAARFSSPASKETPEPKPSTSSGGTTNSNVSKLQFKLPDGSQITNDFASSDTLTSVRSYLQSNAKCTTKYTLATTFPKKEFKAEDDSKTLLELGLVPNAVILVLPLNTGTVLQHQDGSFSSYIWFILTPFLSVLGFLKSFLFGTATSEPKPGPSPSASTSRGSNGVIHIRSKYDLEKRLAAAGTRLVVVDFFATWCGPCKMIAPRLEELAREFSNVVFLKVDVDENSDIARSYQVSSMPTFIFIKSKRVLTNFSGADYYQLRDTITRYK